MIRRRSSRFMLIAAMTLMAFAACEPAPPSTAEVARAPDWHAPAAAHAMPSMRATVADQSEIALAGQPRSLAVVAVPVGSMIAGPVNPVPHRPREKPRLWA